MNKMFGKFFGLVFLCGLFYVTAYAQAEYPDVPLEDPAYKDLQLVLGPLYENGAIESCFPQTPWRGLTRYEFAVAVARVMQNVLFSDSLNSQPEQRRSEFLHKLFQNNAEALPAFERLMMQFKPELKLLGVVDKDIQAAHVIINPSP